MSTDQDTYSEPPTPSPYLTAVTAGPDRHGADRSPPVPAEVAWERRYRCATIGSDITVAVAAAAAGVLLGVVGDVAVGGVLVLAPAVVALLVAVLAATRAWDPQVLGQGAEELNRVVRAYATAAVALALIGLGGPVPELRPWVFGIVPLAGAATWFARYALRKALHRRRARGRCLHPTLAAGTPEAVTDLIRRTERDRATGWRVTGACIGAVPDGTRPTAVLGVPVVGDLDQIAQVAKDGRFRIVSVSATPGWVPRRLHELAWDLEGLHAELVVDPGLMEIAGPRLHVSPVDGLPMLRLTKPTFDGLARIAKNVLERGVAAVLLVLSVPVMLCVAVAVKLDDGGPILFRQVRVGRHGQPFRIVKFRSMTVDAEARRAELSHANEATGPLFKIRSDPRVTRVGAALRRYSLDELPQLVNVVTGTMSLVGPRPPLPTEIRSYTRGAERRLLVKPGMTGLWQVSGRSDLSWEESVRLDLRYVENWSLGMDALIIWKTVGAIVRSRGSY